MRNPSRILSLMLLCLGVFMISCGAAFAKVEYKGIEFEGEVSQAINFARVGGNTASSFLDDSINYVSEARIKMKKELGDGWFLESEGHVRKTDDRRIDRRRDIHLLNFYAKVYNKTYELTFGDFYQNFTRITLNRSLEGFRLIGDYKRRKFKFISIFARAYHGEEGIRHTRYVFADRVEKNLLTDKYYVNDMTLGLNWVYTFDDSGSIQRDTGVLDLENLVVSSDLKVKMFDDLNIETELARSKQKDLDGVLMTGDRWGTAYTLRMDYRRKHRFGVTDMYFDFEKVSPDFYSDAGSIATDREAYYTRLRHRFNRRVNTTLSYRQYHDNLEDNLATTTRVKNPTIVVNFLPFKNDFFNMKNMRMRARYDFREIQSGSRSVDNHTHIVDFDVNHRFNDYTFNGGYYLRRRFDMVGGSDNYTFDYNFGVGYIYNTKNIVARPSFKYRWVNEQYYSPRQKDTQRWIDFGLNVDFYKRLRTRFKYGIAIFDREGTDVDQNRRNWRVDVEYDIFKDLLLQATYYNNDRNFENDLLDYNEHFAELKLRYMF